MSKSPEAKFQDSQWEPIKNPNYATQRVSQEITSGSVLDLGCGDGTFLSLLQKRNIQGTGLDLSEKAVSIARSRGLDCRVYDLTEPLPFPDASIENVVLLDVLEHLHRPDLVLAEVSRVSSKYVYISTPNFASLPARLQVLIGKVPENNTPRDGHMYWMTESVVSRLMSRSGLSVDAVWDNTFWQSKPFIGSIMRTLVWMRPSLFSLSFIRRYSVKSR